MDLILITNPLKRMGEYDIIFTLFDLGLQKLHIRKPSYSKENIAFFLDQMQQEHRQKITIHHHQSLLDQYMLGGLHHTSKTNFIEGLKYPQSKSFHTIREIKENKYPYQYGLISPVFDSITKKNYPAKFSENELTDVIQSSSIPLYALGGIDVQNIDKIKRLGFSGTVVMGAIWKEENTCKIVDKFKRLQEKCNG